MRILAEELVEQVLLRCSVKVLAVSKCVSMKWQILIKSPRFVKLHFNHESNKNSLIFRVNDPESFGGRYQFSYAIFVDGEVPSLTEDADYLRQLPTDHSADMLLGPENGIFLVLSRKKHFGLLNPAMREFKSLPLHPLQDMVRASSLIGFGLEPSGDFKVVTVVQLSMVNVAFIYSISSNSWKIIEAVPDAFVPGEEALNKCKILNGYKHWLVKFTNTDAFSILALNIETEMFEGISIPEALCCTKDPIQLTEYENSRAVLLFVWNVSLDLWVMGKNGSWSKIFKIGPFEEDLSPISVWGKNLIFVGSYFSPLCLVDTETGKLTELIPETVDKFVCDSFTYKESLISIKDEENGSDSIKNFNRNG